MPTKKKSRKRPRPAGRQERLEGIVTEIPTIERAAKDYVAARDERMGLTKREVETRTALIAAMHVSKVEFYKTVDGLECSLTTEEKVKVKGASEEGDE